MYIISSKTGGEMWLKGIKIKGNLKAKKKRVLREREIFKRMYIRMIVSRTIRFLKRNTIDCLEIEMEQNMRNTNVIITFMFYKRVRRDTFPDKNHIFNISKEMILMIIIVLQYYIANQLYRLLYPP